MISQVAAELEIDAHKALEGKGPYMLLSRRKPGTHTCWIFISLSWLVLRPSAQSYEFRVHHCNPKYLLSTQLVIIIGIHVKQLIDLILAIGNSTWIKPSMDCEVKCLITRSCKIKCTHELSITNTPIFLHLFVTCVSKLCSTLFALLVGGHNSRYQ